MLNKQYQIWTQNDANKEMNNQPLFPQKSKLVTHHQNENVWRKKSFTENLTKQANNNLFICLV